jgi:hypothetical protein
MLSTHTFLCSNSDLLDILSRDKNKQKCKTNSNEIRMNAIIKQHSKSKQQKHFVEGFLRFSCYVYKLYNNILKFMSLEHIIMHNPMI